MTGIFDFLAAIFGWFAGRKKNTEVEIAHHDQSVAEKQAADLADHTQPSAAERLSDGTF